MGKQRIISQTKTILWVTTFVVFCTGISFVFSHFFPRGERWLGDWQLSHWPSQPMAQSIVLVHAEEQSAALCGEGRWDLNKLQGTFIALHQAGASVIAPILDVSLPVSTECGGLAGFVQLAEVTKHVGSVVYPDLVPSTLKQAAGRTGFLELSLNETGWVGGLTFDVSSLSSLKVPFGVAVASLNKSRVTSPTPDSFLYVPSAVSQNGKVVFPHHHFTDVWRLIQAGEQEELVRLFKGKLVFLYLDSALNLGSSINKVSGLQVALYHARLANAYLTNSWVVPAPVSMAFLIVASLSWLAVVSIMGKLPQSRLVFIGGIIVLLGGVLILLGFQWRWLWPLLSMGLGVILAIVGISAWKMWQCQSSVHQQIIRREQQLTELEHELSGKQHHVRQLEEQLSEAQLQSNQSVTVIEELQESQNISLTQLDKYQDEIQNTRRKIEHLQKELHDLRQHAPVIPADYSSEVLTEDDQELVQECEVLEIVTRDKAVLRLFHKLKKAARTQIPILLLGETGTGKEVFAKAAHTLSPRRNGPFISVNIAAIRPELFEGELFGHVKGAFTGAVGRTGFLESAHSGTLFLDEVGDLPLDLQAKLLRFLEEGGFYRVGQSAVTHVDVRIIAATNRDLQDEVRTGRYREDLYYRLRSMVLTLPPLRARSQADHVLLAQSFLQQCAQLQHRTILSFTQGALDAIVKYQWPGNIRELRQTIAQAVALANGSVITEAELNVEELRTSGVGQTWGKEDLESQEDALVLECLRRHQFEMQTTAATLGWDRGTVTQRLKGLGFQALMEFQGDIHAAAVALAGDERFVAIVEGRLREYLKNLVPSSKNYGSVEEAIADCRKRFRNLPERHFPAVEQLLHDRFAAS